MKSLLLSLVLLSSGLALASTPPEAVARIDKDRQGRLMRLVLENFMSTEVERCDDHEVEKYEIAKLGSESYNQEKHPGTPYDYEGQYLAMLKCHTGTTFAGAIITLKKAVVIKASFTSEYSSAGGPARMKDLAFERIKTLDLK